MQNINFNILQEFNPKALKATTLTYLKAKKESQLDSYNTSIKKTANKKEVDKVRKNLFKLALDDQSLDLKPNLDLAKSKDILNNSNEQTNFDEFVKPNSQVMHIKRIKPKQPIMVNKIKIFPRKIDDSIEKEYEADDEEDEKFIIKVIPARFQKCTKLKWKK